MALAPFESETPWYHAWGGEELKDLYLMLVSHPSIPKSCTLPPIKRDIHERTSIHECNGGFHKPHSHMPTARLLATSQHWKSSNIADSDHASQDTHGKYGARMVKNSTCHHRRSLSKNPARLAKKLVKLVKCYRMSQDISPPKSHQVAQKPPDPNTDMGPRVAHAQMLIGYVTADPASISALAAPAFVRLNSADPRDRSWGQSGLH